MDRFRETAATVAPYAAWMALMAALPATAASYAVRSAVVCALLALYAVLCRVRVGADALRRALAPGAAVGIAVFALWVLPEGFEPYRRLFVVGGAAQEGPSPYDPAVCGWALTAARLVGSSFVIAPAEELFFRNFLYRWLQKGGDWTASSLRRASIGSTDFGGASR